MASKRIPRRRLQTWANLFCKTDSLASLCELLDVTPTEAKALAYQGHYQTIYIPKRISGQRLIESPEPTLKDLQQTMNFYLQCNYHFCRTDAVYGFVMGADGDRQPRNILTNAQRHVGNGWMMNVDFQDFFHCINYDAVVNVFAGPPFGFDEELSHWLAKLTTQQRLPMGAPTSPVLSNFACRALDYELLNLARDKGWVYTRYVDDLTFSGPMAIGQSDVEAVRMVCEDFGFRFNDEKLTICSPAESKIVTGLMVTPEGVRLADDYVAKVSAEIVKLKHLYELKYRMGQQSIRWATQFRRQIKGAIEFIAFVLGEESPTVLQLQRELTQAINPPSIYDPVSWLDLNYHFY